MIGNCWYVEKNGRFVLIGLSADETDELARLDPLVNNLVSSQEELAELGRRWSELLEKYETAVAVSAAP
jgi:hypothetical protein